MEDINLLCSEDVKTLEFYPWNSENLRNSSWKRIIFFKPADYDAKRSSREVNTEVCSRSPATVRVTLVFTTAGSL